MAGSSYGNFDVGYGPNYGSNTGYNGVGGYGGAHVTSSPYSSYGAASSSYGHNSYNGVYGSSPNSYSNSGAGYMGNNRYPFGYGNNVGY
jgi:hypothetical protein